MFSSVIMRKQGVFFLFLSKESYTVRDSNPESFSFANSKIKAVKTWRPSRIIFLWKEIHQFHIYQKHIKITSKTLSALLTVMQMILVHRNENYGSDYAADWWPTYMYVFLILLEPAVTSYWFYHLLVKQNLCHMFVLCLYDSCFYL